LWTSPAGKAVAESSGKQMPWAPMNTFCNVKSLVTPETSDGGSPKCDTLIQRHGLSTEPLVLSVPAVTDRFYSLDLARISSDRAASAKPTEGSVREG